MKEKIIGVKYSDDRINGFTEFEITVVDGIEPILYQKILLKNWNEIYQQLLEISNRFNAKINFENNVLGIYLLFKEKNNLNILRDNTILIDDFDKIKFFTRNYKGFCYNRSLKDYFYRYDYLLNYNKEFEDSYRIAVLPIIFSIDFQNKIEEIKCFENKLKELKKTL